MKSKLSLYLIMCLVGLCGLSTYAQSPVHFGIKASANFTEMHTNIKDYSSKSAMGYGIGAVVRVDMGKLYLQPELLFVEKNAKFKSATSEEVNTAMKHIEFPLVLGLKIIDAGIVNVRIFGGGVYNYMIQDNFSTAAVGDAFKDFNKSNLGYRFGAGVDLGKLTVDLSYDGGFKDISKNYETKPKTFMVSAGFFIL